MSANDTLDWVRREVDWLETPLAEDKPMLGLCLGAQMLARVLGARVFSYHDKRSEIGYYRSSRRPRAKVSAPRDSRAPSTHGIPTASTCLKAPSSSLWRDEFPQPGLSLRPACGWPAVPPRNYLSHDVLVDASQRRAPDPARRAEPPVGI
jgi:glutamine amidotransferase class I